MIAETIVMIAGLVAIASLMMSPWLTVPWFLRRSQISLAQNSIKLVVVVSWLSHLAGLYWFLLPKGIRLGMGMEQDLLWAVVPMILVQCLLLLKMKILPRTAFLTAILTGVASTLWQYVVLFCFIVLMIMLNS